MEFAGQLRRQRMPPFGGLVAILVSAAVIAGGGVLVFRKINPPPAPLPAQTATVTRGTITASVNATGNVAATQISRLTFRADGTVAEVNVAVGDNVRVGQVLAKLDTHQLDLSVQQARAQADS